MAAAVADGSPFIYSGSLRTWLLYSLCALDHAEILADRKWYFSETDFSVRTFEGCFGRDVGIWTLDLGCEENFAGLRFLGCVGEVWGTVDLLRLFGENGIGIFLI